MTPPHRRAVLAWVGGVVACVLAITGAALTPGCGKATPPSPQHTPDPTVTSVEPRIVVLSPALGVILTDLGLAEHIVGRHGWDTVLDQHLPVCGDQNAIDYESLLRAHPMHVLVEWGTRSLPTRLTDLANEHGWHIESFNILTLDDIAEASAQMRELFPDAVPDDSVERFGRMMASPVPEPVWDGRVLLLMGTDPVAAIGPGSAHHQLLRRAGGVPAITEGSPYMPLNIEDVLRLAPDAIVLIQPGPDSDSGPDKAPAPVDLGSLADLDIPAVRDGRVVRITHPQALLPSTRLVEVAEAMNHALRRWAEE